MLEQYGFEFAKVAGAEIEAGRLRDKYDVIVISRRSPWRPRAAGAGGAAGDEAVRRRRRARSDVPRVKALDEFVRAGGTLVCFNRSSNFAIDQLNLPVKNAIAGVARQQFFTGGSLMSVTTNPAHQVMAGMPEKAVVFFDGGPVFETQPDFKGTVLASYQTEGSPLASGYLLGEKFLQGKAAALDVELGSGHVVLLGLPSAVARPAVRHVPRNLQQRAVHALRRATRIRPRAATGTRPTTVRSSAAISSSMRLATTHAWFGRTRTRSPGTSVQVAGTRTVACSSDSRSTTDRPIGDRARRRRGQTAPVARARVESRARSFELSVLLPQSRIEAVGGGRLTTVASTVSAQSSSAAAPRPTWVRSKNT